MGYDFKHFRPKSRYDIEAYWDEIASKINIRNSGKTLAGDNEPYYYYKRKLFLKKLNQIKFENRSVIEIGTGPGTNLEFLLGKNCKKIVGVDISVNMVDIAKQKPSLESISIIKINGHDLPFENNSFDTVLTSTVLQHNTDEVLLELLIKDMCRVSSDEVIIFERIEKKIKGHDTNIGRPVKYYSAIFKLYGFELTTVSFLKIQASYYVCGIIRKLFNSKKRKEGDPASLVSIVLEKISLPITKIFDKLIPSKRDLGMLRFKKIF